MSFLRELFAYMRARRKFWLAPILILIIVFGGLIILAKGSAIAPFIYTIFGARSCGHRPEPDARESMSKVRVLVCGGEAGGRAAIAARLNEVRGG